MVRKYSRIATATTLALSFLFFSAGCSQKVIKTDKDLTVGSTPKTIEQNVQKPVSQLPPAGSEESLNTPRTNRTSSFTILEGRTTGPMLPIYFNFDQVGVRADQKGRVEKNAQYLKANPEATIVIEGNCDERGTSEYNMALGERRAISAKKYLVNLGVNGNKVNTISYGEEKPLNHGHDELAWSQNRRDDFIQTR